MPTVVRAIGVHGATGRMGTRIIQLSQADPKIRVAAALDRADHPQVGQDAGVLTGVGPLGVPLASELDPSLALDAMIDFSLPKGTLALARICRERKIPLVVGTTGFEPEEKQAIEAMASEIPLLISPNMSRAVNLLFRLAAEAARALRDSADVEIVERHHHFKKDAPSGTALRLAEVVGQAIGSGPDRYTHGRHGVVGDRPRGEIGLHALRTGDNPGEHTVVFGLMGECVELSHRALNRDGFARGAIDAAKFLAGKPAGLYTMSDLLG
ncbi:MAG: 4-hydroxy-tetrahydrodipicolinate reductase [Isosphaeraceae bacterium]